MVEPDSAFFDYLHSPEPRPFAPAPAGGAGRAGGRSAPAASSVADPNG